MARTTFPFESAAAMWEHVGFHPGSWRVATHAETGTILGLPSSGIPLAFDGTRMLLLEPDSRVTLHHKDNFVPTREERDERVKKPRKPRKNIDRYV